MRILRNDESVRGRRNPAGFRKLLMATRDSLGKAVERIGPEETRLITDAIIEQTWRPWERGGKFEEKK
jgi:hypothetical protein